ncbi:MAG: DUF4258 domain-containing protein [Minisyncoccia bacterium]
MKIRYTKHAKEKFKILKEQGFIVKRNLVEEILKSPELIDYSQYPLFIAQKSIDENHILRVVFKKENDIIKVITFYPMRKKKLKR